MDDDATPKRIQRTRPKRYTEPLIFMVSKDTKRAVEEAAAAENAPNAEIARRWLDAGREALGV